MPVHYWIIPLGSALIGFLSLWVSIQILAHHIYPKYRDMWSKALAPWVVAHLASSEALEPDLSGIYHSQDMKKFLEVRMSGVLERFKQKMPMVGFFITDSVKESITSLATEEILQGLPEAQELLIAKVLESGALTRIIEENLRTIDLPMVLPRLAPALNRAYIVAAATGFILGLLEMGLLLVLSR